MCWIFRIFCEFLRNKFCCKTGCELAEDIEFQWIPANNLPAPLPESYSARSTLEAQCKSGCVWTTISQNRQAKRLERHWAFDSLDVCKGTTLAPHLPDLFPDWQPCTAFPEAELSQFQNWEGETQQGKERGEIIFPEPKFIKPLP
ncbi:unnamed protein product [Orchesella dallaii]|uniref:Uncharacterized protein n=1 Tax=Orchesella dallaii TaxID=48710 RepID=A0ABP1S862_9HEXA